jgi:menaquinone-dependent protoporphyrinogen oxidase
MPILVAVASRHGSTLEIARAVAAELQACGMVAEVREAGDVTAVEGYDAVVLGSAVYVGKWLPEARRFVERHQEQLSRLPVWLFSSGPLGAADPQPHGDLPSLPDLLRVTGAREHRTFAGALVGGRLGLGERLIVKVVNAPEGDFRDWGGIRAWAGAIAAALRAEVTADHERSTPPNASAAIPNR